MDRRAEQPKSTQDWQRPPAAANGVSNRLQQNLLRKNDGQGTFTNVALPYGAAGNQKLGAYGHTIGSCWGDLDNDGHLDLFVGNFSHPPDYQDRPQFLRNKGARGRFHFEDRTKTAALRWQESYASPSLADYDNDGWFDLYFTTVYRGDLSSQPLDADVMLPYAQQVLLSQIRSVVQKPQLSDCSSVPHGVLDGADERRTVCRPKSAPADIPNCLCGVWEAGRLERFLDQTQSRTARVHGFGKGILHAAGQAKRNNLAYGEASALTSNEGVLTEFFRCQGEITWPTCKEHCR